MSRAIPRLGRSAAAVAAMLAVAGALAPVAAQAPEAAARAATAAGDHPSETTMPAHPYVGMWVTGDGRIRQELLPNGRYDEARGSRRSAYQGRYEVRGTHIDYWDDTGFTADGTFVTLDELHHGGMVFFREK